MDVCNKFGEWLRASRLGGVMLTAMFICRLYNNNMRQGAKYAVSEDSKQGSLSVASVEVKIVMWQYVSFPLTLIFFCVSNGT